MEQIERCIEQFYVKFETEVKKACEEQDAGAEVEVLDEEEEDAEELDAENGEDNGGLEKGSALGKESIVKSVSKKDSGDVVEAFRVKSSVVSEFNLDQGKDGLNSNRSNVEVKDGYNSNRSSNSRSSRIKDKFKSFSKATISYLEIDYILGEQYLRDEK